MENNIEKEKLNIEDLYSYPKLQYTGILSLGKYISIFLIIVSIAYLWALNPSALYYTVLALSYVLHISFLLTLFCLARYTGNFELKSAQRWLYCSVIIVGLTIVINLTGILQYISGTFSEIAHLGINSSNAAETIIVLMLAVTILVLFLTCVAGFLISGIRLIKFKGDFIGGLKPLGVMLLVYPSVTIVIYLLSVIIEFDSDLYLIYNRFLIICLSCTLAVMGYFSYKLYARAINYLRKGAES